MQPPKYQVIALLVPRAERTEVLENQTEYYGLRCGRICVK